MRLRLVEKAAALGLLVVSWNAAAIPARALSFDVGGGIPELASGHAQVQVWERVQLGFGYTYIPNIGPLENPVKLPSQSVTLANGFSYTMAPDVTPTFGFLIPFIRFFPDRRNNFYIQFTYMLVQMFGKINSGLTDTFTGLPLLGALVRGNLTLTQAVPSIGVGHIFGSQTFFLNVTLGMSWFGAVTSSLSLESFLPDLVGGELENTESFSQVETEIQNAANQIAAQLRAQFPLIPSIHVSFGVYF